MVAAPAMALAMLSGTAAMAQDDDAFARLRAADSRLLDVAAPMMAANARLCPATMPGVGISLHSADQYADPPAAWFANGPVAVAAIAPGSSAAFGGIAPDDAIIAIDGVLVESLTSEPDAPRRDSVFAALAAQQGSEVTLTIRRDGMSQMVNIPTAPACRILVEILTGEKNVARSDGKVVQISYGLASRLSDEQLATVLAHELAHAVLAHRIRLEQAGVNKGLAGEFGRDQRMNREIEVEADRMSVHLLANAGYDPRVAPLFWRSAQGRQISGGFLRSWKYPSASSRAEILDWEIALYLPLGRGPSWPAHLLDRRELP